MRIAVLVAILAVASALNGIDSQSAVAESNCLFR